MIGKNTISIFKTVFFIQLIGFCFVSSANASESYSDCKFNFDDNDTHVSMNMSVVFTANDKYPEGVHRIYDWLCKGVGEGDYFISKTANNPRNPIAMKNNKYWLKVQKDSCDFDIYYSKMGLDGGKFKLDSNYNEKCGIQNTKKGVKDLSPITNYDGSVVYNVTCQNGKKGSIVTNKDVIQWNDIRTGKRELDFISSEVTPMSVANKMCY